MLVQALGGPSPASHPLGFVLIHNEAGYFDQRGRSCNGCSWDGWRVGSDGVPGQVKGYTHVNYLAGLVDIWKDVDFDAVSAWFEQE